MGSQSLHVEYPKLYLDRQVEKQKSYTNTIADSSDTVLFSQRHSGIFFFLLFTVEFSIYMLRQDFSLLPKIACRWIPLLSGPCSFVLIMSAYDSANPVPFWSFGPALYITVFCSVFTHTVPEAHSPGAANHFHNITKDGGRVWCAGCGFVGWSGVWRWQTAVGGKQMSEVAFEANQDQSAKKNSWCRSPDSSRCTSRCLMTQMRIKSALHYTAAGTTKHIHRASRSHRVHIPDGSDSLCVSKSHTSALNTSYFVEISHPQQTAYWRRNKSGVMALAC